MEKVLLLAAIAIFATSCSDAARAKIGGIGEDFKVEIISSATGQIIRTYHSSGKVRSEETSDGYFFMDKGTNELTEIAGGVIIITPEHYTRTVTIK